jgi:hypothetical protein
METQKTASVVAPVPFSVTLADGAIDRLVIKPLPITKLYQWLYLARDQSEPAMVALAVDRDLAWVDSLDVDTFAKLAGKCSEVLFPLALRLAKGAPAAAALVAPMVQRNLLGLRVIDILLTGSGGSSSTPPASESAPATPSASPTPTPSTGSAKSSPPASA